MLKVIIADDEARFCNLILMLADWESLDMIVVATASNGFQALELIQFHNPDILITDIRMPGMDGLELIKKAKDMSPDLEIAVISGHAQFEYAQPAIKYGVVDYLLKPIKQEELMSTLKKLRKCCLERIHSDNVEKELLKSTAENTEHLREKLVLDLIQKNVNEQELCLEKNYKFNYSENDAIQVFITKIDYDSQKCAQTTIGAVQKNAETVFKTVLGRFAKDFIFVSVNSYSYGIITYKTGEEKIRKAFKEAYALLSAKQTLYGNITLSLALGQTVSSCADIAHAFSTSILMIQQRLLNGHEKLLFWSPVSMPQANVNILEKYSKALETVMENHSFDSLNTTVAVLEKSIEETPNVTGLFLRETVLNAANLFVLRIGCENSEEVYRSFEMESDACNSKSELFKCLEVFQQDQLTVIITKTQDDSIRPIRLAKQYIQNHYAEQITLEEVSAKIGFSLNYFSALFKKETGEGFAKYIIRIRIEKAKELLQDTNCSVSEVCFKVGYTNLTHFTQNFKKLTGLNPSQYRKIYG